MIDFHKEIVNALNTILPTHYEMALTSGTKVPCISYMELNNSATDEGNTIGYSSITYQVKIWAHNIENIQQYATAIDAAMRAIGFKRIGAVELYDNNSTMMHKVFTFEALAKEKFN